MIGAVWKNRRQIRALDIHVAAAEFCGDLPLEGGELDQVAIAFGAEVDAVGVHDQLDRS
jgi:hypothetical protein